MGSQIVIDLLTNSWNTVCGCGVVLKPVANKRRHPTKGRAQSDFPGNCNDRAAVGIRIVQVVLDEWKTQTDMTFDQQSIVVNPQVNSLLFRYPIAPPKSGQRAMDGERLQSIV